MIDMKQAVQIAKLKAAELVSTDNLSLEEVEREIYQGRQAWAITLGLPPDPPRGGLAALHPPGRKYRRFYIDIQDGELLAMKLREVSAA